MTDKFVSDVDKSQIPVCNIMGVNIAAINMEWLINFTKENIKQLSGNYICVSNVHTTVMSFDDSNYCAIQNGGILAIPDGGPLSSVGRKRGFSAMARTAGPDYLEEILKISAQEGYRHYFYGSSGETLEKLKRNIEARFPGTEIVGMYSPPYKKREEVTEEEKSADIARIRAANPDFVWVGLGAPKQEFWMAENQGKIMGLMVGVGAAFDYLAGNLLRAPRWMQEANLEWVCRVKQEPKRLFKRYLYSNVKFIWNVVIRGK